MTNVNPQRNKLDSKAAVCVFLVFKFGYKAYKVYDLHTKQVIMSRDVTFYETEFPFANSNVQLNSNAYVFPCLPIACDMQDPPSCSSPTDITPNGH